MNLAEQVAQRLTEIEKQIATLNAEKAALRGAATGKVGTANAATKKAAPVRKVSNAAKAKQAKLRKAAWAEAKKLHKAGKIPAKNLTELAKYRKAHPKE